MGYMQGVTVKGLKLVTKITELINQLTEEDFEDTYVGLRVSLNDECEPDEEVGFWSCEYGYQNWGFFDGARKETKPRPTVSLKEVADAIASATPPHDKAHDSDIDIMAERVLNLLKDRGIL